jgi:DNA-binding CsgD family transcriptional regulator
LILWHSYARVSDLANKGSTEAAKSLIERDWKLYTELEGYRVSGWEGGTSARWYTEYIKASVTQGGLFAAYSALERVDVAAMLPDVQVPTLVIARASPVVPISVMQDLTVAIPDARMITLDGTGAVPFPDATDQFVDAVHRFLKETSAERLNARIDAALTPREAEILRLIAVGRSSSEISQELSLSIRTVGRHITNIYGKIDARSRAEATAYAIRNGIA